MHQNLNFRLDIHFVTIIVIVVVVMKCSSAVYFLNSLYCYPDCFYLFLTNKNVSLVENTDDNRAEEKGKGKEKEEEEKGKEKEEEEKGKEGEE